MTGISGFIGMSSCEVLDPSLIKPLAQDSAGVSISEPLLASSLRRPACGCPLVAMQSFDASTFQM